VGLRADAHHALFCFCSADRAFLRKWKWSQMVMDEAHALKNANSQRSRRLRKLAAGVLASIMSVPRVSTVPLMYEGAWCCSLGCQC
jgi:hypothetical protein